MITPAIILTLLVGPSVVLSIVHRLFGKNLLDAPTRGCLGLSLVFCFTGIGHFIRTEAMAEMMPAWVPAAIPLVYITGVMELAAAAGVFMARSRPAAAWGLAVMLVLFLPVNIYAALNRVGMGGHLWGPVYLLIRVPLQGILLWWVWRFGIRQPGAGKLSPN